MGRVPFTPRYRGADTKYLAKMKLEKLSALAKGLNQTVVVRVEAKGVKRQPNLEVQHEAEGIVLADNGENSRI